MSIADLENLCIQIQKPEGHSRCDIWYRPPNSNVGKFYTSRLLLTCLMPKMHVDYYILDDLNCGLWSPDLESNSRSLIDITELYGLHQLISEPTRITKPFSTMIDHIFTNKPDKIVCSGVFHVGISGHSLIHAFRKVSTGLHNKGHSNSIVHYRKFKNLNSESF